MNLNLRLFARFYSFQVCCVKWIKISLFSFVVISQIQIYTLKLLLQRLLKLCYYFFTLLWVAELKAECLEVLFVTIEHRLLELLFFKILADFMVLFILLTSSLED